MKMEQKKNVEKEIEKKNERYCWERNQFPILFILHLKYYHN